MLQAQVKGGVGRVDGCYGDVAVVRLTPDDVDLLLP